MNRVTAQDVAAAAGVSLATVDRVLNNRKGVRGTTIERVTAAMDRLKFVRDQTAANLARRRSYRFTTAFSTEKILYTINVLNIEDVFSLCVIPLFYVLLYVHHE